MKYRNLQLHLISLIHSLEIHKKILLLHKNNIGNCIHFRTVSVWEWTVLQSENGGEMERSAIRNGTMQDVSMMVVIVAKTLTARNVRMRWLN